MERALRRFGKAAKEAMRRKKYRRRERELDIRYHLQDKGGQHLLGEQQVMGTPTPVAALPSHSSVPWCV